jgi:threonine dehydrogenase-like Zn-dependent dehydrogenase
MVGRDVTKLRLESALAGHLKAYDIVVDATGNASGLETACQLCRPRGTIVLKTTIAGSHQLNLAPLVIDEITLIGSRCGPFPKAISALEADMFPVENLIEAVYTLDQAEKAFEHARQKGAAKVIIKTLQE